MKRAYILLFLFVTIVFVTPFATAEDNTYSLEPTLANAIGYTAEQWFQSEKNRALLTVILGLEYSSYDKSFDINCLYSDTSYVVYAKEYPGLMICMFDDNKSHCIMYMPWLKTAVIAEPVDGASEMAIEMAFELNGYEYEKNSKDALSDAVGYVNGAIQKIMDNY